MLTLEDVQAIFEDASPKWAGDNAFQGLLIIAKYFNPAEESVISGGGHDVMYSVGVEELIERGMPREEFEQLANLNWHLEDDEYLACFV